MVEASWMCPECDEENFIHPNEDEVAVCKKCKVMVCLVKSTVVYNAYKLDEMNTETQDDKVFKRWEQD